jgi:hypothetical protein
MSSPLFGAYTKSARVSPSSIPLQPDEAFEFENREYRGAWFTEHEESADAETKLKNLCASIDNNRSFWPTPASLANFAALVGFTSFYECLNPYHPNPGDRRAYVALKGSASNILSSPATAAMGFIPMPEVMPSPSVESNNAAVRLITRTLPRPLTECLRRAFSSFGQV